MKLKDTKAITLVALIITIIVLLILAGVTIGMLFGDNGIIKNAKEVGEEYTNKAELENEILSRVEQEMQNYIGENGGTTNPEGPALVADVNGYQTRSTKYVTVYPYNSSSDSNENNWTAYNNARTLLYGYGDAILETSTSGSGTTSWNADSSSFPHTTNPFVARGGDYIHGSNVGVFGLVGSSGSASNNIRFSCGSCLTLM